MCCLAENYDRLMKSAPVLRVEERIEWRSEAHERGM
jgi:hypothetical protein